MTVKVVTDSLSDIPPNVIKELGITVIPLMVRFGTEVYRDGVDLTSKQFYEKLVRSKTMPATSVPPPGTFTEVYNRLAEESDEILVITISSKLSGTYDASLQGIAQMKKKCRVEVIDSKFTSMAQGLVVIAAARAARAGSNLNELVDLTRSSIPRVDMRGVFDTLEYLKRGGRIGKAQALLGSMLRINPILTLKDGGVEPVGRSRSRAKALDYLYNFAMSFSRIDEMAVADATTPDEADMLVERLNSKFPKERVYRSQVGPALGTHAGPGFLLLAVQGENKS